MGGIEEKEEKQRGKANLDLPLPASITPSMTAHSLLILDKKEPKE